KWCLTCGREAARRGGEGFPAGAGRDGAEELVAALRATGGG
ncbi:polysaccharide pyruvyl transferase family protein, partial [Streptomyces sp. SID9944]|nr:polysaccharide pyruvyl transferase family protein [Streptomyces sp. SID9944]